MTEPAQKKARAVEGCANCRLNNQPCDLGTPACSYCVSGNTVNLCVYPNQTVDLQSHIEQLKIRIQETKQALAARKSQDEEVYINFYSSYNTLSVKHGFMEDNKPFSEMALVQKDMFLRLFLVSVFYTFKPSKDLAKEYQADPRMHAAWRKGLCMDPQICPNLMQKLNGGEAVNSKLHSLMEEYAKDREQKANFKRSFFPTIFGGMGSSEGSPETNLDELLQLIEAALPDPYVYDAYMEFFLLNVQPFIELLNDDFFQEVRGLMVIDNGRFKLNFGKDWRKIILVATALVVLRISYAAWTLSTDSDFLNQNPISMDVITVALKCIGHINIFKRNNEELLACLMHVRLYFTFAAEENDVMSQSSTDILLSMITNSAFHIGLYKDPDEFLQLKDNPKMKFLRRKLWFMVMLMTRFDVAIRGRFPLLGKEYMYKLKSECPEQDEIINRMNFHIEGMKLLADIDILTTRVHEGTKLSDIEMLLMRTEVFLNDKCHIDQMTKGSTINVYMKNANIFRLNTMMRLFLMAVYESIAVNFEYDSKNSNPVMFNKYFLKMLETCVDLATNSIRFLDGTYSEYFSHLELHKYLLMKLVQATAHRSCYVLFSAILRMFQIIELSKKRFQSVSPTIATISNLANKLLCITTHLNKQLKTTVSEKQYSSLSMVLLFDHSVETLKTKGFEFVTEFLKWHNSKENGASLTIAFREMIRNKMGFDPADVSMSDLENRNHMKHLTVHDLEGIIRLIDSKNLNFEELPRQKSSSYLVPVPTSNSSSTLVDPSISKVRESPLPSGLTPLLDSGPEFMATSNTLYSVSSPSSSLNDANILASFGSYNVPEVSETLPDFGAESELAALFQQPNNVDFLTSFFENIDSTF